MSEFNYRVHGVDAITLHFQCAKCPHQIDSHEIAIPVPALAEPDVESQVTEDDIIECANCGTQYDVDLNSSLAGGFGTVDTLTSPVSVAHIETPQQS